MEAQGEKVPCLHGLLPGNYHCALGVQSSDGQILQFNSRSDNSYELAAQIEDFVSFHLPRLKSDSLVRVDVCSRVERDHRYDCEPLYHFDLIFRRDMEIWIIASDEDWLTYCLHALKITTADHEALLTLCGVYGDMDEKQSATIFGVESPQGKRKVRLRRYLKSRKRNNLV